MHVAAHIVLLLSGAFEEGDKLFDSFNSVKLAVPGKTLLCPLSNNSSHTGHWSKMARGIKSWIFLKDGKPAFQELTSSHNGWCIDIHASQHVWRVFKGASFTILRPNA
jgi:hypothetical protein